MTDTCKTCDGAAVKETGRARYEFIRGETEIQKELNMTTDLDKAIETAATDIIYNAVVGPSRDHLDESEQRTREKLHSHIMPVVEAMRQRESWLQKQCHKKENRIIELLENVVAHGTQLSELKALAREIMERDDRHFCISDGEIGLCEYCGKEVIEPKDRLRCQNRDCVVFKLREMAKQ